VTHTFDSLIRMTPRDLDGILAAGAAPALSSMVGHEFRGWNVFGDVVAKGVGAVMGIQRFAKGFFIRDGADADAAAFIEGYNMKIQRGERDMPWTAIPNDASPTRHGYFRVHRAGEGDRAGRHENALLLDYSLGDPKPGLFDGGGLKDFVVIADKANPDVLLGKAYMRVGPIESVAGFFVLERLRPASFSPALRTRS